MAYYAQPQNQNYYPNSGNYNPGGYMSQPTPYGYPQQPQQQQPPPPPRQQQWQQQPSPYSPYSPVPQPPSPYSPPSPQPPPLQNNLNYGYNAPGNYPPGNPSPQNNSFNVPSTTSSMNTSKPLYDENDPNSPKPPSNYGPKYESGIYQSGVKFGAGEKKNGGIMGPSGRRCCCIVCCILILIIIAIVIAVLLWAKPPKIDFQGVTPSPQGLPSFQLSGGGFDFNFGLNISVDNPNIVGATFTAIRATAFYPGNEVAIGGGNLTNVNIEKQANTTIDFPFTVHYDPASDPGLTVLKDIVSKCGLLPGTQKQQLSIDYQLTLSFKVLAITLSPSFNRTAQINCPIPPGTNIPGLSLLGVGSS